MSLEAFMEEEVGNDDVADLLKRRRYQVMVHACIYYKLNDNLISDHLYDKWCVELVGLLKKHPGAYSDRFDRYFKNWGGESGFHFPHGDPWIQEKALRLLEYRDKNNLK